MHICIMRVYIRNRVRSFEITRDNILFFSQTKEKRIDTNDHFGVTSRATRIMRNMVGGLRKNVKKKSNAIKTNKKCQY